MYQLVPRLFAHNAIFIGKQASQPSDASFPVHLALHLQTGKSPVPICNVMHSFTVAVPLLAKKKPTWWNTQGSPTTSAYAITRLPAWSSVRPTGLRFIQSSDSSSEAALND